MKENGNEIKANAWWYDVDLRWSNLFGRNQRWRGGLLSSWELDERGKIIGDCEDES